MGYIISMKEIFELPGNKENLELLINEKNHLIPFIGAGFSRPACPTWGNFLENFFQNLDKDEFLSPDEKEEYKEIKKKDEPNRFEQMVGFLLDKAQRQKFENEIKKQLDRSLLPVMAEKFQLLHRAFPGLKITTNFDRLLEDPTVSKSHVTVRYGYEPDQLHRLFTNRHQNSLLKIHGGV